MSVVSYEEAKKLMELNKNLLSSIGPKKNEIIKEAEKKVELIFPKDYKMFLSDFGAISFGSDEIYGISKDNLLESGNSNAIYRTITDRVNYKMPKFLFVIYSVGNGELFTLNYNMLNEYGEPKVTSYWPGFDIKAQTFEVIANDFGDFLLETVKNAIENQENN